MAAVTRLDESRLERIGVKMGHVEPLQEAIRAWQVEQAFALGVQTEQAGDMRAAFKHYERAMQLGSADAMVKVGMFRLLGLNAAKIDVRAAFNLFSEAH